MRKSLIVSIAALAMSLSVACCPSPVVHAQGASSPQVHKVAAPVARKGSVIKVAVHVDENDPKLLNLALNNVANISQYYKSKKQKVAIEVVAYGPGLTLLRTENNPVKQRVEAMALEMPHLTFAACGNTIANMTKKEGKPVAVMSEAKVVPSGVIRLIELQRQGYAYLRP